jgi:hypothetical protein
VSFVPSWRSSDLIQKKKPACAGFFCLLKRLCQMRAGVSA